MRRTIRVKFGNGIGMFDTCVRTYFDEELFLSERIGWR